MLNHFDPTYTSRSFETSSLKDYNWQIVESVRDHIQVKYTGTQVLTKSKNIIFINPQKCAMPLTCVWWDAIWCTAMLDGELGYFRSEDNNDFIQLLLCPQMLKMMMTLLIACWLFLTWYDGSKQQFSYGSCFGSGFLLLFLSNTSL